ncbi:MAG: hypothetical protein GY752_04140 [bacterium]|nr:hypothetical protein [bacterium]
MSLLADDRLARDNLATYDDLVSRMNSIESQTLAWMATATTLHGTVDTADRSVIIALRDDLVAKLTAATAI